MLLLLIFLNVNQDVKTQGGRKSIDRIWIFKKKTSVTLTVIISVYFYILRNC